MILAQAISLLILPNDRVPLSTSFRSDFDSVLGSTVGLQLPYIDGLNSVGTSAVGIKDVTASVTSKLEPVGLPTEPGRCVWADDRNPKGAVGFCP